jgi:dTDP-glucose pyrophosphorylase
MKKPKCNCKNFERQVCNICQSVVGKHIFDKPMKDHPIEECMTACFDEFKAIVVKPKKKRKR